ncbi:putative integral membrane protein [Brugia pahangi]
MSEEEDLMEEAMFDLVEISIFCVFSVIEFYMSSGAEIRAIMDSMCVRYLEHNIRINGFLKEKVYNICTDVKIEAYGFLSSGCIFLFLVFLFAIDLIILLKNAEEVESRKYLQMAACLHYDRPLKCMSKSVLEGVFIESTPNSK